MATEFKLPELGENIAAGDIVSVLVKEGDVIAPNTAVVEIETDKAVIEVPSPQGGRVTKVHIKQGDTVSVGGTLITLEPAGAAVPTAKQAAPVAASAAKPAQPQAAQPAAPQPAAVQAAPAPKPQPTPVAAQAVPGPAHPTAPTTHQTTHQASDNGGGNGVGTTDPAGPAVRRLARELGVDLGRVTGTGPGGRITRDDVVNAVRQMAAGSAAPPARQATPSAPARTQKLAPTATTAPATTDGSADHDSWGPVRRQAMAKIRKTIAVNMAKSASTIPHVTNFDDADVTELEAIRKASAADYAATGTKITMMSFLLKAIAHSLKLHPTLNASLDMERGEIIFKDYVNIGVAVDTDRGLVVPVMRSVDRMAIPQIAQALTTLAERAKAAQYTVDDLRGGTFTISNMGTVGGTYSTPIINSPEVAVLLIGRSRKLPVVMKDDRIEPRLMMPLSLSYDHRLVDGANAARFLNEVINFLEVPGRLLLAP